MRRPLILCALALSATALPGSSLASRATIGLVPGASPAITEALADGIRLALEEEVGEGELRFDLVVGSGVTHWSTAAAPAVELAFTPDVVALVTPPDRATAHLAAQIGSRAHIPVLTTARAPSIGATGSYWVIPMLELEGLSDEASLEPPAIDRSDPALLDFYRAFGSRFGHGADGWAVTGYRAARAIREAVRRHGPDRYGIARELSARGLSRPAD